MRASIMDEEPYRDAKITPDAANKPAIRPPDLSKRPPPPPSPLDNLPKSAPPPPLPAGGEPAVKVRIRSAEDADGEGAPAEGIAAFNPRAVAAVIDLLVSMGVTIGLSWLLPNILDWIAQLAGTAYFITRDSLPFLGGQSVGKKAMKLKATTLDGNSLVENWTAAVIRNGVLLIPFFAFVELFLLLNRENGPDRGRRLGDEWAKTRVIVEEPPAVPEEE